MVMTCLHTLAAHSCVTLGALTFLSLYQSYQVNKSECEPCAAVLWIIFLWEAFFFFLNTSDFFALLSRMLLTPLVFGFGVKRLFCFIFSLFHVNCLCLLCNFHSFYLKFLLLWQILVLLAVAKLLKLYYVN